MEKKAEEAAAKKSKARAQDIEAKGKWWPCTTTETELCNLEAEGFLKPGSWQTLPVSLTPAPEAGEMVVTKALVERGFSFPPSGFLSEILKAYGLQPHNISPNSILAISNHVALCEGHLRVTPELSLFQYFFSVKKEKIPQTSELATCGTITFKLRPGRVYPPTDRHESARYWSRDFFYLKDVSDPACARVLPAFKNGPASETPAWTQCPHLSESPQLTRAVRRICKLTEDSLSGKDLTMSLFTKRIQPLQHRDRLMFQYTGCDDLMRASKDNLSGDAIDKRIRLLIKIPRDLRIHVCNKDIHVNGSGIALEELVEKDLGTRIQIPHSGTNDPEVASDVEIPETSGPAKRKRAAPSGPTPKRARETPSAAATRRAEKENQRLKQIDTSKQLQPYIDQFFMTSSKTSGSKLSKNPKKKAKPSPASVPVTPEVEVPPKESSSAKPDPKDIINLNDLPKELAAESGKGDSDKGASSPAPPPERPDVTSAEALAEAKVPLSKRHAEISSMMDKVWGPATTEQQEMNDLESGLKIFFAKHKEVRQNTRKLHENLRTHVLEQKTEIEMLQQRDAENQKSIATLETCLKNYEGVPQGIHRERDKGEKEREEKHAQAIAELNDKLKKSNARIKTLVAKEKTFETEAENIDKLIFPTLRFEWNQETATRTEAYEDVRNFINDLFEACRGIATSLSLKRAGTTVIDRMTKLMRMVPALIKDWQASSARGVASLTLATCKAHCPKMNLAEVTRRLPKGTNVKLALAETQGASTKLWRIIEEGYSPRDPKSLTRRDVVDDQLNATAINMIHMAITHKDRTHIRSLKTAKEAWDKLEKLFLGNASIQSSRFDEVNNMADNFVMVEGETPEEMYRRLIALAVQMQDLGATFVDDHWIKRKFYNALLPYEEVKLTAIRQNASFRAMTSDEILSEVIALDISKKNAEDLVARAHNSRKPNLALKMKVHEASESDEDPVEWGSDDLKINYHEHMALAAKKFWDGNMPRSSRLRRSHDSPRRFSKGPREGTKERTCYNCGDKNHFVADCMFERREDHGGRLIPKDKHKSLSKGFSKFSPRSDDDKVSSNKKPRAFIIREEYSSDEDGEHEDMRSNKEGEGIHVVALLAQLGVAQDLIEKREKLEREAAFELANLTEELDDERNLRMSLEASVIILEDKNEAIVSRLTKDRDHALELVGDLKKKMLSLEEANKGKDDEDLNPCHDELVDQVTSLRRHNALLLEVNALQEEALDEYYRLFKEKTSCCNHEEEIAALEITKAKLLSLSSKQEEPLVECLRMSNEKDTCCDHEEEIAALKRREAKLMEVNSMQEETLKEYFPLSKDRACCTHESDIAKMENDKRMLTKINALQEEALMEHFRVNKAKEVQVFDICHPHPEHEDEVNRLKAKIDRLQVQAKYLEGIIEAKDEAKEGSCNEGGVATKAKGKRKRRTKKKKNKENMETNLEGSNASSRKDGVPNSALTGLEKTPYEILTSNKPNVSYFKVFGCKCYILVKDTRLSKFDSRAQEGIFVGYATDSHAYRVFNKSSGCVVESCDVTFDEDDRSLEERSASLPRKDQVPPKWSHLHHKAKLLPLILQMQANLYNNLKFNLNLKINLDIYNNNQVQLHINKLKNNIHRKLVYYNNQHQVTKVKLQVLHRVVRG
ncbi:hypothetical protein QYE76_034602 [Lolium multiflorum]|uniref:CCHC-type domain-containing protein n=1 Tax=Lolium multiflorum TaxID=4521 RepID=A0AAD8QZX9_LOLMU|nr:hypothetical protein QYE76_034602 [Lolium multiflorum]